jgi:hypothetical protein
VHKKQFKDTPTEKHHMQADPALKARIHRGEFVHELWHLMQYLMPTLHEDIAGDQRMLPLFPDQDTAMAEVTVGKLDQITFDVLMKDYFDETVESKDATKAEVAYLALADKWCMKKEEVYAFLPTRGLFKKKNKFHGYAYHVESKTKNGKIVWCKLKDALLPKPL